MNINDVVRVEGRWFGVIVDLGCRRVRVRPLAGRDEEDVDCADVEVLDRDEAVLVEVMES